MTAQRFVLPVIHHRDAATSRAQADLAFAAGADGVFLISHEEKDEDLYDPAQMIKASHPERKVGVNFLTMNAREAFAMTMLLRLDMAWLDAPGISSAGIDRRAHDLDRLLQRMGSTPQVFASVAFKYQPVDSDPPAAAVAAYRLGMVPTTSGDATGSSPAVEKIAAMRAALPQAAPLAIASGMTPENVGDYLPYVSHILVATGVSRDEHHFDEDKLRRFVQEVRRFG